LCSVLQRDAGSSVFMTDWNKEPKMAGEMASQVKSQTSSRRCRIPASTRGWVGVPRTGRHSRKGIVEGLHRVAAGDGPLGIQNLEELNQPLAHVAAVFLGSLLNQVEEDVPGLEDASIVRRTGRRATGLEGVQGHAQRTRILQCIMELPISSEALMLTGSWSRKVRFVRRG